MMEIKKFLQNLVSSVHKEWRERRAEDAKKKTEEVTWINQEKWFSTIPLDKAEIIWKALERVNNPEWITEEVAVEIDVVIAGRGLRCRSGDGGKGRALGCGGNHAVTPTDWEASILSTL